MAWRSHGTSNAELVNNMRRNGIISDPRVVDALLAVDRANFCKHDPYYDAPQSIGYAVSISAPHMHGHALQHLRHQLREGATALDVGSGSGYLTACMAVMVGEEGRVIGVEHIPELVDLSKRNIAKGNADLLKSKRLRILGKSGPAAMFRLSERDVIWMQLRMVGWGIRRRRRMMPFTSELLVANFLNK